jgi:hypothetical protein
MNFSVTKMQEENKIAQLVFLNKTNFLTISKTLAFWFGQEKPDKKKQLNSSHTENHTRPTNLSA